MVQQSGPLERGVAGYNRLAACYRTLERCLFAEQLQRARVALLGQLPRVQNVWVLGDGDGRFLHAFCSLCPDARVDSFDFSPEMLRLQKKRIAGIQRAGSVRFHCQEARSIEPIPGSCDLLVCNFFLDCFTESELRESLPKWLRCLKPGGHFYVTDFVPVRTGWWKYKSAVDQFLMHRLFRWQTGLANQTLVDWGGVLEEQSLVLEHVAPGLIPMVTCRLYRHAG